MDVEKIRIGMEQMGEELEDGNIEQRVRERWRVEDGKQG